MSRNDSSASLVVYAQGLAEQLLNVVVKHERADLEEQRESLIQQMSNNKVLLSKLEESLLSNLSNASGNILDNQVYRQELFPVARAESRLQCPCMTPIYQARLITTLLTASAQFAYHRLLLNLCCLSCASCFGASHRACSFAHCKLMHASAGCCAKPADWKTFCL